MKWTVENHTLKVPETHLDDPHPPFPVGEVDSAHSILFSVSVYPAIGDKLLNSA